MRAIDGPRRGGNMRRSMAERVFRAAFAGDVHGNLAALEAVLSEMRTRGVEQLFVAGDLLLPEASRPGRVDARPLEVWFRLQEVGATLVRGISDTALARMDPARLLPRTDEQREAARRFAETRKALGEFVLARLLQLPERTRVPLPDGSEIVVVHGSPRDPTQEIAHDMPEQDVRALVGDDPADLVVCAATHVPWERDYGDLRVVNVGSMGAAPEGRSAHVTFLLATADGIQVEQTAVEY